MDKGMKRLLQIALVVVSLSITAFYVAGNIRAQQPRLVVQIDSIQDSDEYLTEALTKQLWAAGYTTHVITDAEPDLVVRISVSWRKADKLTAEPNMPREIAVMVDYDGPLRKKSYKAGLGFGVNRDEAPHREGNYREEDLAEAAARVIIEDINELVANTR